MLRHGIAVLPQLDPGSTQYDPADAHSSAIDVNGVCWLSAGEHDPNEAWTPYVSTTVKQQTYVQVTVPTAYYGHESPLPLLKRAVTTAGSADPPQQLICA